MIKKGFKDAALWVALTEIVQTTRHGPLSETDQERRQRQEGRAAAVELQGRLLQSYQRELDQNLQALECVLIPHVEHHLTVH